MEEVQRLNLILEAVNYCKKVRDMGMPSSAYSKALREPIHFLWEIKDGSKFKVAKFRSQNAVGLKYGDNQIVYDHSIPFNYLKEVLLGEQNLNIENLKTYLEKHTVACLITKEEDQRLNKLGLNRKMPRNWDGVDPLARYQEADIKVVLNCTSVINKELCRSNYRATLS